MSHQQRNATALAARIRAQVRARGPARLLREEAYLRTDGALLERRLRSVARSRRPLLVGPFLGEVGFEVLYWIPLIRAMCARHDLDPAHVVAVSRGGVARWYEGVAGSYVDVRDLLPADAFDEALQERRRAAGDQKQVAKAMLDRRLERLARAHVGLPPLGLHLHPRVMHVLLRDIWASRRPPEDVLDHVQFAKLSAGDARPEAAAALRIYDNLAFADTPDNRRWVDAFADQLVRAMPVVATVTERPLDGHSDLVPACEDVRRIRADAHDSLARHSAVLGAAAVAVTTYGGMAYVALLHGVPTIGLRAQDGDNPVHLAVARLAARQLGATFHVVDIRHTTPADAAALAGRLARGTGD